MTKSTYAQTINATSSILTLNAQNIDDAMNNQDRLINLAKLHIATVPELNIMTSGHNLLVCVDKLLVPPALKLSQPTLAGQQPQTQQTTGHHHHKGSNTGASTSTGSNSTGH